MGLFIGWKWEKRLEKNEHERSRLKELSHVFFQQLALASEKKQKKRVRT
jgi:hypothetical protein